MDVIIKGAMYGLLLSLIIGPVFFSLIQTSIHRGFNSALFITIGVSLSDIAYIIASFLGISFLSQNDAVSIWLGLGGGIMLLIFGITTISSKTKQIAATHIKPNHWTKQIAHGFFLNGFNPFVLFFWTSIASKVSMDFQYSNTQAFQFYSTLAVVVWATDVIKIYFASKLKRLMTNRIIRVLNLVVGIALIGFGIKLLHYIWSSTT